MTFIDHVERDNFTMILNSLGCKFSDVVEIIPRLSGDISDLIIQQSDGCLCMFPIAVYTDTELPLLRSFIESEQLKERMENVFKD